MATGQPQCRQMATTTATTANNATKFFLGSIDSETRNAIISNIANHYGISESQALAEVTDDEAASLLDYLTGITRTATSLLMKRHGIAA